MAEGLELGGGTEWWLRGPLPPTSIVKALWKRKRNRRQKLHVSSGEISSQGVGVACVGAKAEKAMRNRRLGMLKNEGGSPREGKSSELQKVMAVLQREECFRWWFQERSDRFSMP